MSAKSRVAATGGLFAAAPSSASTAVAVPADECVLSIVSQDELETVEAQGSDAYYVPRKKDLLKKERERQRKKEELDFSDDEDEEELDGLGAIKAARTKAKPPASSAGSRFHPKEEEEQKERSADEDEAPSVAASILVLSPSGRPAVPVTEPQRPAASLEKPRGDAAVSAQKPRRLAQQMSDEEEEEAPRSKQPPPRSSSSASPRPTSTAAGGNVAPLINPVALTFFLHRFALTCLGGLQLRFASSPPRSVLPLSLASFALPAALVLALSGAAYAGGLPTTEAALVSGGVAFALHAALHLWSARAARGRTAPQDGGEADGWTQPGAVLAFLFPAPSQPALASPVLRLLTASVCYATLVGLATAALPFSHPLLSASSGGYGLLVALCLLSVCASLYPLQHRALVDPNVWDATTDPPSSYTRPLHLLLILAPLTLVTYLPSLHTQAPALSLLVLLAALPVLHAVGVLPQWSPLVAYTAEQAGLLLFGAPPSAALRYVGVTLASLLAASAVVFVLAVYASSSATVLVAVALALPVNCCWEAAGQRVGKAACLLVAAALIVVGAVLDAMGVDLLSSLSSVAPSASQWWWDGPLLLWFCVTAALSATRHPYLFRLLRNPLYASQPLPVALLTGPPLSVFLTLYLTVNLAVSDAELTASIPSFLLSALLLRLYLSAWRSPASTMAALTALLVVDHSAASSAFTALPWQLRVWAACVLLSRLRVLWSRLLFFAALTWTTQTQPRLKTRHPRALLVLSVVLLPYHLLLLLLSSLLSFPVYPLLGAPILLPSFPRRTRVWPSVAAAPQASLSSFYYQRLVDAARPHLPRLMSAASVPDDGRPSVVLLRAEPYTLVLVVAAHGPSATRVWYKGLELQRTSCHTAESLHLDECLDRWAARPALNPHPLHLYQPCGRVQLDAYVPSSVNLTGVLDSREALQAVRAAFYRQLLLHVHRHLGDSNPAAVAQWPAAIPAPELTEAAAALPRALMSLLFPSAALPGVGGPAATQGVVRLVLALYALVYALPAPSARPLSTAALYSLYAGRLPLSLYSGGAAAASPWAAVMVAAFRTAVALVFHAYCEGEMERVESDGKEYRAWAEDVEGRVGVGGPGEDVGRVMEETGKAEWFALEQKEGGSLAAVRVQRQAVDFAVVRAEWAAWEAVWVGSAVELLYFGNDDDERYSIQAHEGILRNTIVQAAEAPVGYAAFTGEEVCVARQGLE